MNLSKTNKICLAAFLILFSAMPLFAQKEAAFTGEDYDIHLVYNDISYPGDAVFVRMKFLQGNKKNKTSREQFTSTTATLSLYLNGKRLDKTEFYPLSDQTNRNTLTLLAGLPLSSWWTKDDGYKLVVEYNLYGTKAMEFELPFNLENKEFESETIPLNESNTNIKTDTSPKRMSQIEKLNGILATKNTKAVYQTSAFTAPTTATRRTSFFADRRVYAYSNGKSSTSLHYGTDYGIPTGSTVSACAAGKVVLAEDRVSTGWSVVVEHLPGLYSLYYHMSELKVKEGDMVKAGDLLGLSGATGLATGPHLHWEMRLNMSAVNPDYFTQDFTFDKIEF